MLITDLLPTCTIFFVKKKAFDASFSRSGSREYHSRLV